MMLNQRFEVDVKVRQNSRQKSHVSGEVNLDLSACELREEIAPAAVSKKKHESLCSVSVSHSQERPQSEILMDSVRTILWIGLRFGFPKLLSCCLVNELLDRSSASLTCGS